MVSIYQLTGKSTNSTTCLLSKYKIPKDRVCLGKRSQKGSGVLTNILAKLLVGAGNVIGV